MRYGKYQFNQNRNQSRAQIGFKAAFERKILKPGIKPKHESSCVSKKLKGEIRIK